MFEIAVILLIITAFSMIMQKSADRQQEAVPNQIVVEKKVCPPHKWEWQEIVDQNGTPHDARLICKVCAQTPGSL